MRAKLKLPHVTWITPTYCRPQTLPNLIACFLAQRYPADRMRLVILDDADQYGPNCNGDRWQVVSIAERYPSLPAKFNALASLFVPREFDDILIVAEDDDSFLPEHTMAHVDALFDGDFSKPSRVRSDYGCTTFGECIEEAADGRFHGSIAFRRSHFEERGGWPETDQANFDQQMLSHFAASGRTVDPCEFAEPQYVFRWHTNQYHGQSLASGPGDTEWYRNHEVQRLARRKVETIVPQLDPYTQALYARLNYL